MAFRLFTQRSKKPKFRCKSWSKQPCRISIYFTRRWLNLLRKLEFSNFWLHLIFATCEDGKSRQKMMDNITYPIFVYVRMEWLKLSPNNWLRFYWVANGNSFFSSCKWFMNKACNGYQVSVSAPTFCMMFILFFYFWLSHWSCIITLTLDPFKMSIVDAESKMDKLLFNYLTMWPRLFNRRRKFVIYTRTGCPLIIEQPNSAYLWPTSRQKITWLTCSKLVQYFS